MLANAARGLRGFWLGQVDLAPLGAFRIVFGLLTVNWIWQLYPNLAGFFTDEGMLPRRSLYTIYDGRLTLLGPVGDWWPVAIFWAAALVVALMLTIGWHTRTAAILCFIAISSFQWRNPVILDGSDTLFRAMPLWLALTAAGDKYAVDAAVRRARGESPSGFGWALPVRLIELQAAWIYLATGIEKIVGGGWLEGSATYYALQLKYTFGRWWAEAIATSPWLVRPMTWGTLAIELGFLPLAFLPWKLHWPGRIVAILLALSLHGGILLLMNVGNFPIVMMACLILFLPPSFVKAAVLRAGAPLRRTRTTLLYDSACTECARAARFLSALDLCSTLTVVDFATPEGQALAGRTGSAAPPRTLLALDERDRVTSGFRALMTAGRGLPLLAPLSALAALPVLGGLMGALHGWLADRGVFVIGGEPGGAMETPARRVRTYRAWLPAPVRAFALVTFAGVALATALPKWSDFQWPDPLHTTVRLGGVDQRWDMFSPNPARQDGWLAIPATLADGTRIDLLTGGPVMDPLTPRYSDPFYTRWVKVQERIATESGRQFRLEYGRMWCRMRNLHLQPGQVRIERFDITYTERTIQPPGGGPPRFEVHELWSHRC